MLVLHRDTEFSLYQCLKLEVCASLEYSFCFCFSCYTSLKKNKNGAPGGLSRLSSCLQSRL